MMAAGTGCTTALMRYLQSIVDAVSVIPDLPQMYARTLAGCVCTGDTLPAYYRWPELPKTTINWLVPKRQDRHCGG